MIYTWTVVLQGTGTDKDSAWVDAVNAFSEDPGATPEPDMVEDEEDPTPYCTGCGAMTESKCKCGPFADNY